MFGSCLGLLAGELVLRASGAQPPVRVNASIWSGLAMALDWYDRAVGVGVSPSNAVLDVDYAPRRRRLSTLLRVLLVVPTEPERQRRKASTVPFRTGARRAGAVAAVLVASLAVPGAMAGILRGVYAGNARWGHYQMDISLQTLRGGRSVNWNVDVSGPCSRPGIGMGRSVGNYAGSGLGPLRLRAGRFAITRRGSIPGHPDIYSYALVGHAIAGGYAGTFRYGETSNYTDPSTVCDSPLMHWRARPSKRPFP